MPAPSNSPKKTKPKKSTTPSSKKDSAPRVPKKKPAKKPARSRDELKELGAKGVKDYGKAANTGISYDGHVRRTRAMLEEIVAVEKAAKETQDTKRQERGSDSDEDGDDEDDEEPRIVIDPDFEVCLDGPPNARTPEAISLFMTYKCFDEGKKGSTATSIHAAWKRFYDVL